MLHPSWSLQSAPLPLHPSKWLHSAQPMLHSSWSFHSAPLLLHPSRSLHSAPECAMSSPAGNDATDIVAVEVDDDDSPLSSASPEVVRLPLWDDLGRSYNLNCNL